MAALAENRVFGVRQGHAGAQLNLGVLYANGEGLQQDDVEAVCWYRKAAEQGIADVQVDLGEKYVNGEGVKKDNAEALRWRKAARHGHDGAKKNIKVLKDCLRADAAAAEPAASSLRTPHPCLSTSRGPSSQLSFTLAHRPVPPAFQCAAWHSLLQ